MTENQDKPKKIDLEDIKAAKPTDIPDTPDERSRQEERDLELQKLHTEIEGLKQDIRERARYAGRIFLLIVFWLLGIFLILLVQGWGSQYVFQLSDKVLITLIGGTTLNILGIFVIVARYLFYRPQTDLLPTLQKGSSLLSQSESKQKN